MRTLDNPDRSLQVDLPLLKITFLVVSYARPERLWLCLESIKQQLYANYEIVVSDDGTPNDETKDIAERYGAKFVRGDRLVIDGVEHRNLPGVLNQAQPYIEGDIIQVLQRDHIIAPDFGLWLARTYSPFYAMIGLTDHTDVKFTLDDVNALLRTVHIPENEVRYDKYMYSGRATLQEILSWKEMDGLDLAFHKSMLLGVDTEMWGHGHFWLDFLLRLKLSGARFMLNPMMKLWNFRDPDPTDEDWKADMDRTYKYMADKWSPEVWLVMPQDHMGLRKHAGELREQFGVA